MKLNEKIHILKEKQGRAGCSALLCWSIPHLIVRPYVIVPPLASSFGRRWSVHVVVGPYTSVDLGVELPCHCGLPYHGIRLPSSACGVERRRWATHVVVGCPTAVFDSPRYRVVSNIGVGLPTSLRVAVLGRSCLVVVVGSRTSTLGYPRRCGLPNFGVRHHWVAYLRVRLPTSLWAALPRRLCLVVVVESRTSALGCTCRCGLPYRGV